MRHLRVTDYASISELPPFELQDQFLKAVVVLTISMSYVAEYV